VSFFTQSSFQSKLATARNVQSVEDVDDAHLTLGLFAYPVLQAADILLYRATHVPVGEDQVQHLELCRDIGDIFNRTFKSKLFPLPQHLLTPTKRVLSLRDPTQKMSKSHPEVASRILLTDSDSEIANKIKRAVTDGEPSLSYDPEKRPGVSNLLSIMAGLQSRRGLAITPQEIAETLNRDQGGKGSALKAAVSETVIQSIRPIRDELQRIKADGGYLDEVERIGREKAQKKAAETMDRVRRLVGLQ
jgi:tryptophanyl-tRNA synthetase